MFYTRMYIIVKNKMYVNSTFNKIKETPYKPIPKRTCKSIKVPNCVFNNHGFSSNYNLIQ